MTPFNRDLNSILFYFYCYDMSSLIVCACGNDFLILHVTLPVITTIIKWFEKHPFTTNVENFIVSSIIIEKIEKREQQFFFYTIYDRFDYRSSYLITVILIRQHGLNNYFHTFTCAFTRAPDDKLRISSFRLNILFRMSCSACLCIKRV